MGWEYEKIKGVHVYVEELLLASNDCMSMFCNDIIGYCCCIDITEIFINKRKTGTPKKIAHISADNIIRMLKMVPLE